MKKIIALVLSLMLILCAAAAGAETAETVEKTDLGSVDAFNFRGVVPEGYTYSLITSGGLNLIGMLASADATPLITISIAYNEEYADVERFNDVDEATVEEIKASFLDLDDVTFEDAETAYGTRLLKVIQANRDFVDIYTIYKGYEMDFVIVAQNEVTDAAVQILVDFISSMDLIPVE